jgi:putative transcriptional regulator
MSEILESMHELAEGLHRVGAMDDLTMKAMKDLCLPAPRKLGKAEVKAIRRKTGMSQPVFAAFLGVSPSAVAQWERGAKSPSGPAARLLDVIDRKGAAAIA